MRLGELIQEAGFPEGVVNIPAGYGETQVRPAAHADDVDKGGLHRPTEVGKLIAVTRPPAI